MHHWNLQDPIDCFVVGLLVADGYVRQKDMGGGIDMCDESLVKLVADRFGAPVRMRARKKDHKPQWRDQFIAQWSSGQPDGYRERKPQPAWLELVDSGLMLPNKKYAGMNVDVLAEWDLQARMWFHSGFVEGDGHVRHGQVVIENHGSMLPYHEVFRSDTGASGRTNNRGHVISHICRRDLRQKFLDMTADLVVVSGKIKFIADDLEQESNGNRKMVVVDGREFPSIQAAAMDNGVSPSTIVRWINNEQKEARWAS